jgi:hypothetical protein
MKRKKYFVCFPLAEAVICGLPATVELTEPQARSMARAHLGGLSALRTAGFTALCVTIRQLTAKGLLDNQGLTDLGRRVAKSLADDGVI